MGLGGPELILIGAAVLLLFGGKKLPELMRGLGKGINEFKNAKEGVITSQDEPATVNSPIPEKTIIS
ncbi:MAG: twin-arginine translocase TatA/TatE family subunit [Daejeonella sp.]|uniref:Sec-independent protein translocase subunit TatA/TatB n=1 Tax=Daejeonella sp. TaxID=2805397 RepID=UPI003C787225